MKTEKEKNWKRKLDCVSARRFGSTIYRLFGEDEEAATEGCTDRDRDNTGDCSLIGPVPTQWWPQCCTLRNSTSAVFRRTKPNHKISWAVVKCMMCLWSRFHCFKQEHLDFCTNLRYSCFHFINTHALFMPITVAESFGIFSSIF